MQVGMEIITRLGENDGFLTSLLLVLNYYRENDGFLTSLLLVLNYYKDNVRNQ